MRPHWARGARSGSIALAVLAGIGRSREWAVAHSHATTPTFPRGKPTAPNDNSNARSSLDDLGEVAIGRILHDDAQPVAVQKGLRSGSSSRGLLAHMRPGRGACGQAARAGMPRPGRSYAAHDCSRGRHTGTRPLGARCSEGGWQPHLIVGDHVGVAHGCEQPDLVDGVFALRLRRAGSGGCGPATTLPPVSSRAWEMAGVARVAAYWLGKLRRSCDLLGRRARARPRKRAHPGPARGQHIASLTAALCVSRCAPVRCAPLAAGRTWLMLRTSISLSAYV
jgi:hypothetical protein